MFCKILFFTLVLGFLDYSASAKTFNELGYTYDAETKMFYKLHMTRKSWHNALATCKGEGAKLAVPLSNEVYDKIVERAKSIHPFLLDRSVWIGLHSFYKEKTFLTVFGNMPRFTQWGTGQPDLSDNPRPKQCVMMDSNQKYNNDFCDSDHMFICQASSCQNSFRNQQCRTNDRGYFFSSKTNHCYKMYTTPKSWNQAFEQCQADNARLVVINSAEEANVLKRNFKSTECRGEIRCERRQAYIGMSDFLTPGNMLTIDGKTPEESGYNTWFSIFHRTDRGKCGIVSGFGKLGRIDCNNKLGFICEKTLSDSC